MNDQSWRRDLLLEPDALPRADGPQPDLVAAASALYRARRRLMTAHPNARVWFQLPAWDILLDLFVAAGQGRQVNVSSACIAAGVPNTTALRWLKRLEAAGMIVSEGDTGDRRLRRITLTDFGTDWMVDYLTAH